MMINNIPKPQLSSDFTIEDIHKIREWNYECLKDATINEWIAEIKRQAEPGIKMLKKVQITQS